MKKLLSVLLTLTIILSSIASLIISASAADTKSDPIKKLPLESLKDGMANEYYNCPDDHHYCTFARINITKYSGYNEGTDAKGTTPVCLDEFGNVTVWNNDVPGIRHFIFEETPWGIMGYREPYENLKGVSKATFKRSNEDPEWQKVYNKYNKKLRLSVIKKMQAAGFYDENFKPLKSRKKMREEISWYAAPLEYNYYNAYEALKVLNKKGSGFGKYYNDDSLTPAQRLEGYFKEWEKIWKTVDFDESYSKYRNK